MFSYDVSIYTLQKPLQFGSITLKANANLIIDNILVVKGFKIFQKGDDLWVSPPSEKSNKTDDNGKTIYYDTIYFIDEKPENARQTIAQKEIFDYIISEYRKKIASPARTVSARVEKTRATASQDDQDIMLVGSEWE